MGVSAAVADTRSLVPGVSPQIYSSADFEAIARLLRDEAGIVLSDNKKMLAYSRIAPLLRETHCETFDAYLRKVGEDAALRTRTVAALTTNHTYFNRESHHYEHFAKVVRPHLLQLAEARQPVRLWSAACSSGEEIWTLMMVLLGEDKAAGRHIADRDIVALATDLADHALKAAAEARYESKAMEAVPEALRRNWCTNGGKETQVDPALRNMVRFRRLNLLRAWPFKTLFDVIFCRNVMIYFDQPTKEQLVLRLAQQLQPGAYLYIGHSERVSGEAADMLELVGPTVYRRRD